MLDGVCRYGIHHAFLHSIHKLQGSTEELVILNAGER